MTRRWISLMMLTVLALLAGCGGNDSTPSDPEKAAAQTTTPAPPASYSRDELLAALPTSDQLPGGLTLTRTCPADVEQCESYPEGLVVAEIEAAPASPVGAEQIQNQATPRDFVAVQGQAHPDATAAAMIQTARGEAEKYTGEYEVKADGRTSRGEGTLDELEIGAWAGFVHRRTEVSSDSETDEGLLIAMAHVASGSNRVAAFVSLSAAGRDPDAAADLADSLVREYIERLA